jgi:hypothetical protein
MPRASGIRASLMWVSTIKSPSNNKPKMDLATVAMQALAVHKAKRSFSDLSIRRPNRPPMPGTATPAGYVIYKRPAPPDATRLERIRDAALLWGSSPIVAALQLVWLLALGAVFVVFVGCLLYQFGWGTATWADYGCIGNFSCCECDLASGALSYRVEDYWQERTAQALSALFTYSVLLATPWRISVALQCFDQCCCSRTQARCHGKTKGVGVDFYGRPNGMNFFHIPWGSRLAIAVLLNLNTLLQLSHQVLHIVWNDVVTYFMQPNGFVLLLTGPAAGVVTGVPVALLQLYHETRLHCKDARRFPPTPINTLSELCGRMARGESLCALLREMSAHQEASRTGPLSTSSTASNASSPPASPKKLKQKKKAKACQITASRAKSRSIGAGIDQVSSYAMSKHSAFGASNGAFSDHL